MTNQLIKKAGRKKGSIPWNKGKPWSSEHKAKLSKAWETRPPHSVETRKKMSESHKGEKAYQYIKDRTQVKRFWEERDNPEYKTWRMKVWKRDSFKCKMCNKDCKGKIQAHHILRWKDYPELRYDINNGITLCEYHHPRKKEEESKLSPFFQTLIANI